VYNRRGRAPLITTEHAFSQSVTRRPAAGRDLARVVPPQAVSPV